MKEVTYYEVIEWDWKCPECGCFNEEVPINNLKYMDTVICNKCKAEFKPVPYLGLNRGGKNG